jgi:pantoate--beta-alanine ligase
MALIDEAARHADDVAVSIFVNPTQFAPGEDLSRYPRPLERDLALCEAHGVAFVFTPGPEDLYPPGEQTRVCVSALAQPLCGKSRPGHFTGVATVVTKLLTLAGPCVAVFGKKDYQQLKIIERMVRDLCLPTRIVPHAIVRESDGLALSSRNAYLSAEERQQALAIVRGLSAACRAFAADERGVRQLEGLVLAELEGSALRPDYVQVVDAEELSSLGERVEGAHALLAVAAFAGTTRLIDNCVLGLDAPPLD